MQEKYEDFDDFMRRFGEVVNMPRKEPITADTFDEDDYTNNLIDKEVYSEVTARMMAKKKKELFEVKKMEINIGSLNKTEKRIWIKPISKRKGHYRKVKGAKKVEGKENLQSYIERLSKTEDGKIKVVDTEHYILGGFGIFNEYLRGGMEGTIGEFDEKIKNITSFLTDAPKFKAIVYRGMFFDERTRGTTKIMEDFLDNLKIGGDVEMVAFTSTTKDRDKAIKFTGSCDNPEDCTRILFGIKSKNGIDVEPMSKFGHEKEVIFNRKTKFNIKSIVRNPPNNVNIEMEEI